MKEDKKLEKRKNLEIVILSIIIVALLGVLIYLLFIRKDTSNEPPKPQDNQQKENDKTNLVNDGKTCTLNMSNKDTLSIGDSCGDYLPINHKVIVQNINVENVLYELVYESIGNSKDDYENGTINIYLSKNGDDKILIDTHSTENYHVLSEIITYGNDLLTIKESGYNDLPKKEETYNIAWLYKQNSFSKYAGTYKDSKGSLYSFELKNNGIVCKKDNVTIFEKGELEDVKNNIITIGGWINESLQCAEYQFVLNSTTKEIVSYNHNPNGYCTNVGLE